MAIILDTYFEDDFLAWTCYQATPPSTPYKRVFGWGCNARYAWCCCNGCIAQTLFATEAAGPTTVTFRGRVAIFVAVASRTSGTLISEFVNVVSGADCNSGGAGPYFFLDVTGDGAMHIHIPEYVPTNTVTYSTSAGVVPVDGTPFAFQLVINATSTTAAALSLYVNNVSVFSTTYTRTGSAWGHRRMNELNVVSNYDGITFAVVWANIQLANTATVADYLPCNQPEVTSAIAACTAYAITLTALTGACETDRLTVTGTNLTAYLTITVTDPLGKTVDYTIISVSSTHIVLKLDDPISVGQYCVEII